MIRDLEKVRSHLQISALDRVRLVVEAQEEQLVFQMECRSCDDLLDWDESRGWWTCLRCHQEVTKQESLEVFRACYAALGWLLKGELESVGKGGWRERLFELMKR